MRLLTKVEFIKKKEEKSTVWAGTCEPVFPLFPLVLSSFFHSFVKGKTRCSSTPVFEIHFHFRHGWTSTSASLRSGSSQFAQLRYRISLRSRQMLPSPSFFAWMRAQQGNSVIPSLQFALTLHHLFPWVLVVN